MVNVIDQVSVILFLLLFFSFSFLFIRPVYDMISKSEHGVLKNTDNHDHILTPNQSSQHILWKHLSQLSHGLMSVQVSGL